MLQEQVLVRDDATAASWARPRLSKDRRKEILRVLERAAQDNDFIAQLTHQGQKALQAYNLSWRERAALLSGDTRWIEAHVGKLDARQRTWLDCRLQQEKW